MQGSFHKSVEVCEVDANVGCAVAFSNDDERVYPLCGYGDRGDDTLSYHIFQDFFNRVTLGDSDWSSVAQGKRLVI